MRRRMRRNPWLAALLLVAPLAVGAASEKARPEADDGMDVYFRDSDLSALSTQDLETYTADEAGESQRLGRAFPDAPPQIPHSVEDMLPITATINHDDHIMKAVCEMVDQDTSLLPVLKGRNVVGVVRSVDVLSEIALVI